MDQTESGSKVKPDFQQNFVASFEAVEEYETEVKLLIVPNQYDQDPKDFLHFHWLPSLLPLEVLNTAVILLPNQAVVILLALLLVGRAEVKQDFLGSRVTDEAYA